MYLAFMQILHEHLHFSWSLAFYTKIQNSSFWATFGFSDNFGVWEKLLSTFMRNLEQLFKNIYEQLVDSPNAYHRLSLGGIWKLLIFHYVSHAHISRWLGLSGHSRNISLKLWLFVLRSLDLKHLKSTPFITF